MRWRRIARVSGSKKRRRTRLYEVWASMRRRILCPTCPWYDRWGGRGIKICAEWDDFEVFREWALLNGYRKGLSIDRIDSNGHYEPRNCRWIPIAHQQDNTRVTHQLTVDGVTKGLPYWSRLYGVRSTTINSRVRAGWPHKLAVTAPNGTTRKSLEKGAEQ